MVRFRRYQCRQSKAVGRRMLTDLFARSRCLLPPVPPPCLCFDALSDSSAEPQSPMTSNAAYQSGTGGGGPHQYRGHSPTSAGLSASPGYRSSSNAGYLPQSHSVDPGSIHQRHSSISSATSPNDYSSSWTPTSPSLSSHPGTRTNSVYSLDGQLSNMGMSSTSTSSLDSAATPQSMYGSNNGGSRYPPQAGLVDRRFSLDERGRPLSGTPTGVGAKPFGAANPTGGASSAGRSWPWGPNVSNPQGQLRSSYEHGAPTGRLGVGSGSSANYPQYDAFGSNSDSPTRFRSMSSSAIAGPGRGHPYATSSYHNPAAGGGAAAIGLVPPGHMGSADLLQQPGLDPHGHNVQAVGVAGSPPQLGPGGGVTRRAKFKRSRTGCLVCRKRKVKCAQDGTPCKQCRIGKRECYYQENPPKRKRKGKGEPASSADKSKSSNGAGSKSSNQGLRYDAVYAGQLPPPPGTGFGMPFNHHEHALGGGGASGLHPNLPPPSQHNYHDGPTFGSAGWPLPPGEAHHRASFDAATSRASFSSSTSSAYQPRTGSFDAGSASGSASGMPMPMGSAGHSQTPLDRESSQEQAHSTQTGGGTGWYDPVAEHHGSNGSLGRSYGDAATAA